MAKVNLTLEQYSSEDGKITSHNVVDEEVEFNCRKKINRDDNSVDVIFRWMKTIL